ncbi:tetratricopeptide repeat protein [Prochlorococcus marinus]|uniref:tetratricopeptide repeat protein n=1 Tax=Prochlorococcus marinus TaxID=1219 RepID=UPI0022B41503|nr:tetratricopeptide repeat protein [Prochlorococcus marinus]
MEAYLEIAQSLFKQNKYQETIDTCNQILSTDRNSIEALKLLAKSFLATRKIDDARLNFNKALNIKPDDYESIKDLGNTYQMIGDINNAKKYYQKALKINSSYAPALTNLGSIELNTNNKIQALSLLSKATKSDPHLAPAWINLANGYIQFRKVKEAEVSIRKAIELNPSLFNSHFLLANILIGQKKLQESEQPLRTTIELKPDLFQAHFNLGAILKDLGKLQDAEFSTRKAIELNPEFASAHSNLGMILKDLGKLQDAEFSTRKAIELNPDLAKAYEILGLILLEKGDYDASLKYFLESAELLRGQKKQESINSRLSQISKAKIDHDIEQYEYLVSKGYESEKFTALAMVYKKVAAEIDWPSETQSIFLDNHHQSLIKGSYNRLIHQIEAPKLKKEAISNSLDVAKITNDYFDHEFGLTYIDDLLSPTALESLRNFLLGSTIWFDVKKGGYLGAYLKEGLANPLIIQIANELRKKFPKIFRNHPIRQIWAYKYDSRAKNKNSSLKGINVHADFAAINVNFWITPKEANLNSDSGGLIVYDVEAPKEWDFQTYNNDEKRIKEELKKSKGNTKVIPYKENRAVVFNSNLFHETDNYEFKEGYENRRINVTILFGKRSDS